MKEQVCLERAEKRKLRMKVKERVMEVWGG